MPEVHAVPEQATAQHMLGHHGPLQKVLLLKPQQAATEKVLS